MCRGCGTIIDTIFIEQFIGITYESANELVKSVRNAIKFKKVQGYKMRLDEYKKEVSQYEDFGKRCRKNVRVDLNAIKIVLNGGKARVYKHFSDDELMRILKEDGITKKILEILDEDAILSSRTFRSKVALALLIKNLLIHGEADLDEIAHKTKVSKIHMQRLANILKTRMKILKPKLIEMKKLLSSPISISS